MFNKVNMLQCSIRNNAAQHYFLKIYLKRARGNFSICSIKRLPSLPKSTPLTKEPASIPMS